ncbi:MAG: GspE/PulE family protein [Pirellulaceae bacterium]
MPTTRHGDETRLSWEDLDPNDDNYAVQVVDRLLQFALRVGASDVHVSQRHGRIQLRLRVHGLLQDLGSLSDGSVSTILGRLKALARLVTYRNDIPQEGSIRLINPGETAPWEARIGTLPTLGGERAVIRLNPGNSTRRTMSELGLEEELHQRLCQGLQVDSGVIVIAGAAGTGKTTTAYACLQQILETQQLRSIVTLEDPVESEIDGVDQSEIGTSPEYSWSAGLKALLRQDPEVMFVGEIRDAETASTVFQAAMTGQLVITTMHARSCCDCLRRLMDMGVPPQHLIATLNLMLCQRLKPVACPKCNRDTNASSDTSIGSFSKLSAQPACDQCKGTSILGRELQAEHLPEIRLDLAERLNRNADTLDLQAAAVALGMHPLA